MKKKPLAMNEALSKNIKDKVIISRARTVLGKVLMEVIFDERMD